MDEDIRERLRGKIHVFLSYAQPRSEEGNSLSGSPDAVAAGLAKSIRQKLRSWGMDGSPPAEFDAYLDTSSGRAGDPLQPQLREMLNRCDAFVAILDGRYLRSGWCMWELSQMVESRFGSVDGAEYPDIVPIMVETVDDEDWSFCRKHYPVAYALLDTVVRNEGFLGHTISSSAEFELAFRRLVERIVDRITSYRRNSLDSLEADRSRSTRVRVRKAAIGITCAALLLLATGLACQHQGRSSGLPETDEGEKLRASLQSAPLDRVARPYLVESLTLLVDLEDSEDGTRRTLTERCVYTLRAVAPINKEGGVDDVFREYYRAQASGARVMHIEGSHLSEFPAGDLPRAGYHTGEPSDDLQYQLSYTADQGELVTIVTGCTQEFSLPRPQRPWPTNDLRGSGEQVPAQDPVGWVDFHRYYTPKEHIGRLTIVLTSDCESFEPIVKGAWRKNPNGDPIVETASLRTTNDDRRVHTLTHSWSNVYPETVLYLFYRW